MNKSVVKKLVQAKILEYEALKEGLDEKMPESIKEKMGDFSKEVTNIAREIILEQMMTKSCGAYESNEKQDTHQKNQSGSDEINKTSKMHKVNIQFGEEQV